MYTGQGLVYTQLQCLKFAGNEDWFVDAHVQVYVFGKSGEELASRKVVHFSKSSNDLEIWRSRVNPNISDFLLVDNKLTLEIHVQIKNMSGAKEKLKSFDESMKDFSDIVLVVDNERFYVNKMVNNIVIFTTRNKKISVSRLSFGLLQEAIHRQSSWFRPIRNSCDGYE